ncbi:MAG: hypothetical protein VX252_08015 [Myxococcota bacterium]|nr:hypothetical protein [Myxococcota bacterium]
MKVGRVLGLWTRGGVCILLLFSTVSLASDRGADGEFEERRSSHFILYQDVDIDETSGFHGSRRFEQRVLEVLESAYDTLDRQVGLRPAQPITVVVYDPEVYDHQFVGLFRFAAAGFYAGRIHIRGGVSLSPSLSRVLHHELVHAALDQAMGSAYLPAWFNEGVAEWFEARSAGKRRLSAQERTFLHRASQQGALFSFQQLSSPTFAGFGPGAAQIAYLESYGFVAYLAQHHSENRVRDWIREVVRNRDLDRATRRTFRTDLGRLEERYLEELAQGGP